MFSSNGWARPFGRARAGPKADRSYSLWGDCVLERDWSVAGDPLGLEPIVASSLPTFPWQLPSLGVDFLVQARIQIRQLIKAINYNGLALRHLGCRMPETDSATRMVSYEILFGYGS